jgi:hypothetical protein
MAGRLCCVYDTRPAALIRKRRHTSVVAMNFQIECSELKAALERTGFACVPDALDVAEFRSLREESLSQRQHAKRVTDNREVSYSGFLADLGPIALDFLTGRAVSDFLLRVFGETFNLTHGSSCYTYYESGDYLSAHMDGADDCTVTMLVYLHAESPDSAARRSGLRLDIFADDDGKPGEAVHAIETREGNLIAGYGSRTWHGRPPLQDGERVYLLTACFTAAS